jgi:Glutaredoxin-like domain (DUF836)
MNTYLILYSKAGCHLCEGLLEKLQQIETIKTQKWLLEIRDITTNPDWFEKYQYEVPVLCQKLPTGEKMIPRPSPRATVEQVEKLLTKHLISS